METGKSEHLRSMTQGVTNIGSSARESITKPKQFNASAININLKAAMQALSNKQQESSTRKSSEIV